MRVKSERQSQVSCVRKSIKNDRHLRSCTYLIYEVLTVVMGVIIYNGKKITERQRQPIRGTRSKHILNHMRSQLITRLGHSIIYVRLELRLMMMVVERDRTGQQQ